MNKHALPGLATRVRWCIKDRNRNELQRLSDALLFRSHWKAPLSEVSRVLVARGLLSSKERNHALSLFPTF
ncbi:hypothetical protein OAL13_00205 [bacterium]|nr:hypothetical protein [bacterium]